MIFWWSVTRLTNFIDECMRRGYIQEELDSLNEEIYNTNNGVDNNKRNIKALANSINELKKDRPNEEKNIPIDVDALIAIIEEKVQAISNQNEKNIASIKRRMDDVARSQLTKSEVESVVKKILSENPSNTVTANIDEIDRIQNKVEEIEGVVKHIFSKEITQADVEDIVRKYIESLDIASPNPVIDEDSIVARAKSDCITTVNNAIAHNNAVINNTLQSYSNEIKKISSESMDNTKLVAKIQADYEEEKKKADSLSEIVKSQANSIDLLLGKISELTKRVEVLEQGGGKVSPPVKKSFIFGLSSAEDAENLSLLLAQAKELRNKIVNICNDSEDVYVKLVDNLIDKVEKIIERNKEKNYSADKLANEVSKILKQTIIKGMSQEKVKAVVKQYMDDCGIRKLDWNIGKKISDTDYEYLEEPIIYVDVNNENESETIVAIIQDTYIIDYIEDDEKYEAIIPGMYRIGRYNK